MMLERFDPQRQEHLVFLRECIEDPSASKLFRNLHPLIPVSQIVNLEQVINGFVFVFREGISCVGFMYAHDISWKNGVCMIGGMIHPQFRKKGCALRCGSKMCDYLFSSFNFHKITMQALREDPVIARIAEKLFFEQEAVLIEECMFEGKRCDEIRYFITRPMFLAGKE